MRRWKFTWVIGLLPLLCHGTWREQIDLGGYLRGSLVDWEEMAGEGSQQTLLLTSRQRLRVYSAFGLTVGAELRQRALLGKDAGRLGSLAEATGSGLRVLDMGATVMDRQEAMVSMDLDRLWLDWSLAALQVTAGRQRIAWGTGLVWNPVDLFNPVSPFDFDNRERPGADALRLQMYPSTSAKFDLAWVPAADGHGAVTALKAGANWLETDVSLLVGTREKDLCAGATWSGQLLQGGFRGEYLAILPESRLGADPRHSAMLDLDYTWPGSLYLHTAVLYQSAGSTDSPDLIEAEALRLLSPSRWSWLVQVARELHPLFRAELASIINPIDSSFFLGPGFSWSLRENLDLEGNAFLYHGSGGTQFGDTGRLALLRLYCSW